MRSRINIKSLQKMMRDANENYSCITDKDSYLIIGNPGLRDKDGKYLNFLTGKKEIIKSSKNILYPELHQVDKDILLCECPDFGFFEEPDKEKKISQAISLQLTFNLAKSIKGLLIVFDCNDLTTCRGNSFRELAVHLSNLFGDNLGTIFDYSNIVIFNCPSKLETNDDIFSIINKMIADTEEQLPTSDSEDSDEELNPALQELENHLRFYKAITSHRDQVFLLDDNENNETRKKFLSSLVTLKPIKPEMINFDAFYRPILEKIEFNIHEFVSDMSDKIQENKFQPMLSSSVMTNEISDYICHENEIYVYYIKPNELYSSLHVFMTDNKFHLLSFTHQNNAHLLEKNYRLLFNNSHPLSTINASRDKDSYVQHRPLFDNETEMFSKITENITIMHKKCKDFITNNEWLIHNKKFLETFIKLINATIDSPKSYGGVIGGMTIDNIRKVLLYQLSELKRIEINFCASTDLTARAANEFMPKPPSPTTTPTNLPDELSKN